MKYALVTGASRGLGKATAIRLAKDGFSVIINYQSNKEAAEDTLRQIEENGGQGELLPFDVSSAEAIEKALESWSAAHPDDYISVLVNFSGFFRPPTIYISSPCNHFFQDFFCFGESLFRGPSRWVCV